MTNFILISNIGLVAIPEYINENDFVKFIFTSNDGW